MSYLKKRIRLTKIRLSKTKIRSCLVSQYTDRDVAFFQVIPMTDENVQNQINCFQVNGTEVSPVLPQSILPNLEGFQNLGEVEYYGQKCEKWEKKETVGKKYNKYTMWLQTVKSTLDPSLSMAIPVHYEMKGYNTLLGSHFDHYFLDYTVRIVIIENVQLS